VEIDDADLSCPGSSLLAEEKIDGYESPRQKLFPAAGVTRMKGHVLMLRALIHGSSLGKSSLCLSQSSRSLVSRSDWEMRSKANAPVKRSS
jgi:hypothetical protein